MAEIVSIQERMARTPRRTPPLQFGDAKILLFTGVRYERYGAAAHRPKTSGPKQAKKR